MVGSHNRWTGIGPRYIDTFVWGCSQRIGRQYRRKASLANDSQIPLRSIRASLKWYMTFPTRRLSVRAYNQLHTAECQKLMQKFLLLILLLPSKISWAFEAYYDCIQVAETSVEWSPREQQYKPVAHSQIDKPVVVKLTGLDTNEPMLTGYGVTKVVKVSKAPGTLWLVEKAPRGTIIIWTLFEKNPKARIPKTVLISSKNYELANFTALYECRGWPSWD